MSGSGSDNKGSDKDRGLSEVVDLAGFRRRSGSLSAEDQAIEWIARLRGRPGDSGLQREFALWLQQDPEHKTAFDAMSQIWLLSGPAAKRAKTQRIKRYHPGAITGFAASVMLAAALFVTSLAVPTYSTERGEQQRVVLQDGSIAHLNTHSEVRVRYHNGVRELALVRGEIWVDVRSDADAPFRIVTDTAIAQAIGTAFAVRSMGGESIITVTEGEVEVRNQNQTLSTRLKAGERVVLDATGTSGPVHAADGEQSLSWRTGQLVYEDVELGAVLADLSRYGRKNMALSDDRFARTRISAVFHLSDQDTMLDAMGMALNVSWKHVSDDLVLIVPN